MAGSYATRVAQEFRIRGEGSGEKGTLRPSSDAYAGIADLCIPLVSRKRWPLSLCCSDCRLGLLSSILPTSQSNGSKAVYMEDSPSSEDLTIEVQSTSCRKSLCCPQVHPCKRVMEDGDWPS